MYSPLELIRIESISNFTTLIKGKGHKYIKRELKDAGPPKKYRYWYKHPRAGIITDTALHVGAKFQHGRADQAGHYEIVGGPDVNGKYQIKHDETGSRRSMSANELKQFMHTHHQQARNEGWQRRLNAYKQAWINGTDKQVAARKKDVMDWARGYWGRTSNTEQEISRIERENPRRITPLRSRQAQTSEDRRRARQQQDKILDRITSAIRVGDHPAYRTARKEWQTHRQRYGALSTGYRQKVSQARQEAKERRERLQRSADKNRERLRGANDAVQAYDARDMSWLDDAMPPNIRATRTAIAAYDALSSDASANLYRDKIATFAGARVTNPDEDRNWTFRVYDKDNNRVTSGYTRSIQTVNRGGRVVGVDLHNNYLEIRPSMRGGDWNAQKMYARQEDWLLHATKHLPDDVKANVQVTIYADIDVGKYYWATQGFRYASNADRVGHLDSLRKAANDLIVGAGILRDESGQRMTAQDAGWKTEDLRAFRDKIEGLLAEARDPSIPNDAKVEPWEILESTPPGPNLTVRNSDWNPTMPDSKRLIPCTLAKYLMLAGPSWSAVKNIHGMSDRDKACNAAGNRRRALAAAKDAKAGKPWEWLGDDVNARLRQMNKSLGFRVVSRRQPPTLRRLFSLSKAKKEKIVPDGITVEELPNVDDELAYAEAKQAPEQIKMLDSVIKLFDEMLELPDEATD